VLKTIIALFLSLSLISCATYQGKISESRQLLKEGRYEPALEKLKDLAEKDGDDQLVYMMDYATALQMAGHYKESAEAFNKADRLVDLKDYHSLTKIGAATLAGEEMVQYKGESYEKFLINTLNAINYVMLGQLDDAIVEARRINEKISKMRMDGREPYELSPFARYLSAVLWEAQHRYDDAYIDYDGSYKLDHSNPLLPADLIRSAKMARREDAYKSWKKTFPHVQESPRWYDSGLGELVVIYQQGWGPQKQPRPGQYRFPMLRPVFNETQRADILLNGKDQGQTKLVYNVEQVAIETLDKDFGALVARRLGGVAAKAVVADQIRQKNELLGALAWVGMNLADRADLRQWSTLPQTIQMAKLRLPPGEYELKIQGLNADGKNTEDVLPSQKIQIRAGRKTFVNWRSLH
jgi:tetratricopeptide (TPR) repeat protein